MKALKHLNKAASRQEIVTSICTEANTESVLEIGVYKGDMAAHLLERCPGIEQYIMLDPWRQLEDWNKPANKDNSEFERIYQLAMDRTKAFKSKLSVLRGTTQEKIDEITDASIDMAYIDGDHTLRGISIDLISVWPKMKPSGIIIGDDFSPTIWQHNFSFEPTLVFPWAIHFAEAKQKTIIALPHNQFMIPMESDRFEFIDHSNNEYASKIELGGQLQVPVEQAKNSVGIKGALSQKWPFLKTLLKR